MWVTEEVSLVDFYRLGLDLARQSRYEILMTLVARAADAAGAYETLINDWVSIDDLTGPKILFLVAGGSIRGSETSITFHNRRSGRLAFTSGAVMLKSKALPKNNPTLPDFDLQCLRAHTAANHLQFGTDLGSSARHHPERPASRKIVDSQTSQTRELRDFLRLREVDVPCLHLTFLDGNPPIHYHLLPEVNLYETLKAIVNALESPKFVAIKGEIEGVHARLRSLDTERQGLQTQLDETAKLSLQLGMLTLVLRQVPGLGARQQKELCELVCRLESHASVRNEESRRAVFDSFKAVRQNLSQLPNWSFIRSRLQKFVDLASKPRFGFLGQPQLVLGENEIRARLQDLSKNYGDLRHINNEQLKRRRLILADALPPRERQEMLDKIGNAEEKEMDQKNDVPSLFHGAVFGDNAVVVVGDNNHTKISNSVKKGDFESLAALLKKGKVENVDINGLKDAIVADGEPMHGQYGEGVKAWIGKMAGKAIDGSWNIGIDAAGTLLAEGLKAFFGW